MEMNILKYMAFLKTVETGSFTKAAELLNYSQSGVSRMISDLEREWRIPLLERDRNGIRLTSDGSRLLPYAQSVCAEYRKLRMEVDDLHGVQSGMIRIGTFSSGAIHWVPNIIKAFQKDYPGVDYELLLGDYSEIEEWIAQGRVDCGFLRLPAAAYPAGIRYHPFGAGPASGHSAGGAPAGKLRQGPHCRAVCRALHAAGKGRPGRGLRGLRAQRSETPGTLHHLG